MEQAEAIQRFLAEQHERERAERNDPELDALEDRAHALAEELREVRRQIAARKVAAAEFQVGDEVEVQTYGRDRWLWRSAVVHKVVPRSWGGGSEYHVALVTKKGVPGRVTRSVAAIRRRGDA